MPSREGCGALCGSPVTSEGIDEVKDLFFFFGRGLERDWEAAGGKEGVGGRGGLRAWTG